MIVWVIAGLLGVATGLRVGWALVNKQSVVSAAMMLVNPNFDVHQFVRSSDAVYITAPIKPVSRPNATTFTYCRRLGANKLIVAGQADPAIRFAVWAPNATDVALVRGDIASGYIGTDGQGVTATIPMHREEDGIWATQVADAAALADFRGFDHTAYMYRITKDDDETSPTGPISTPAVRSARAAEGTRRMTDPPSWNGTRQDLDGGKSCSVVIDPDRVTAVFDECARNGQRVECLEGEEPVWPETGGWRKMLLAKRIRADRPRTVADRGLGDLRAARATARPQSRGRPGDAAGCHGFHPLPPRPGRELRRTDADVGVPGRQRLGLQHLPLLRHRVRRRRARQVQMVRARVPSQRHRRHSRRRLQPLRHDAERAEWLYDTNAPERNCYHWYEERPASAYEAAARGARTLPDHGGYLKTARRGAHPTSGPKRPPMLYSSAAALVSEFHFDGFRVDLTQAIHRDNHLEGADGVCPQPTSSASSFCANGRIRFG